MPVSPTGVGPSSPVPLLSPPVWAVPSTRGRQPALAQVRLFGALTIHDPPLDLGSPTTRSLFAYLLLHQAHPCDRRQLALLFWPDAPETAARRNLRQYLHRLRRALELLQGPAELLLVEGSTVQMQPDALFEVDLWQFEQHLAAAETDHPARPDDAPGVAIAHLQAAADLYRDDLLTDLADDWCQPRRQEARQRCIQTLARLIELYEARGQPAQAIAAANRLLELEPWQEAVHVRLMALYYLDGARAQALMQYERCRAALAEELGAAPLPFTTSLAAQMRAGAWQKPASWPPALLPGPAPDSAPGLPARFPSGPQPGRQPAPAPDLPAASAWRARSAGAARPAAPGGAPFVARAADLAFLAERMAHAQAGRGSVVLIEGESGIGKTRLLQEAWWQSGQTLTLLSGLSCEFEGMMPFHPLLDALRSGLTAIDWAWFTPPPAWLAPVAALLPEVTARFPHLPKPQAEGNEDLRHLIEGLGRFLLTLASRRPLLLLLEDMHWADMPTWQFLAYLARRSPGAATLVGLTCQPELLSAEQGSLVRSMQRQGWLLRWPLARLNRTETTQLIQALDPSLNLGSVYLQRLYEETEGNPLFVVETVKALQESGAAELTAARQPSRTPGLLFGLGDTEAGGRRSPFALPLRVQHVIEARLDRLRDSSRQLLGVAATIGRAFSFRTLQAASEQPEAEVIASLEDWLRRGIVREREDASDTGQGGPRYDFSHPQIRAVAYNELSRVRRRWVHRRVAQALETSAVGQQPLDAALLAYHYSQSDAPLQALPYLIQAGDQALRARSYASARELGLQAVGLLKQAPPAAHAATRVDLNLQLATAHSFTHELAQAQTILLETERLAAALGDPLRLGRVHQRMAQVCWLQGQPGLAGEYARRSQQAAESAGDADLLLAPLRMLARAAIAVGAFDDAIVYLTRYCDLAQPEMLHSELAIVCGYLGVAWARVGGWQRAVGECQRGVALAEMGGNTSALIVARMQLAFVLAAQRDFDGCRDALRPIWPACDETGLSPHCFMATNLWGRALCALEGLEAGQPHLLRALNWAAESGYRVFFYLAHLFLAEAHLAEGQAAAAATWAQQGLDLARRAGDRWAAGAALRLYGDALARLPAPDWPAVEQTLIASLDLLRQIRARPDLARTYVSLRRLYDRTGQMAWAVDCHFRAASIFDELNMHEELREMQGAAAQTGRPAVVISGAALRGPHSSPSAELGRAAEPRP